MLHLSQQALTAMDARGLAAVLRASPSAATATALLDAIAGLPDADETLTTAFADATASAAPAELQALATQLGVLCKTGGRAPSAAALRLLAELKQQTGDTSGAFATFSRLAAIAGTEERKIALLSIARLQLKNGSAAEALTSLRSALRTGSLSRDFILKAERLYRSIIAQTEDTGKPLRIALLGSGTTTFLAGALRMAAVRDGFAPEIYEGAYGAYRQEILDPASELYAFKPQLVILATNWRDAHLPAFTGSGEAAAAEAVASDFKSLWALLLERCACTVLQNAFDLPWDDSAGHLGFALAGGRPRLLLAANEALRCAAPQGVVIVETDAIAATVGKRQWADVRQWLMHGQYPAADCLPLLAEAYLALIRAALGMSKKVLVLDLDNTLWGGVIGEDGIAGIRLGPPSPEGEAHLAFQRYAKELKERGVLLAVCSKNNDADARQPFTEHESMVLRLDDFVAFHAGWEPKPQAVKRMAQELRLGTDSFVFVDDNPAERALMRQELPEVAVPEIDGANPAGYIATLAAGRYFEALALSAEDAARHADYKANAERASLLAAAGDSDAFLHQLGMQVSHGAFSDRVFDRVVQLLGKTNQFNLTTRRHTPEQIRKYMADPAVWTQWFRLEDKFSDNGLVGLLIAVSAAANEWEIDTFLMSCRVIGRRMEDYMIATLLQAARERGIRRVTGHYLPTPKNAMVADLYPRLGFTAAQTPDAFIFEQWDNTPAVPDCFSVKSDS